MSVQKCTAGSNPASFEMIKTINYSGIIFLKKPLRKVLGNIYTKEFLKILSKNKIKFYKTLNNKKNLNINLFKYSKEKLTFSGKQLTQWKFTKKKIRKIISRLLGRKIYEKRFNRPISKDYFYVFDFNLKKVTKYDPYKLNLEPSDNNFTSLNSRWKKRSKKLTIKRIIEIHNVKLNLFNLKKYNVFFSKNNKFVSIKNLSFKKIYRHLSIQLKNSELDRINYWNKLYNNIEGYDAEYPVVSDFNSQTLVKKNNISDKLKQKQNWISFFVT